MGINFEDFSSKFITLVVLLPDFFTHLVLAIIWCYQLLPVTFVFNNEK